MNSPLYTQTETNYIAKRLSQDLLQKSIRVVICTLGLLFYISYSQPAEACSTPVYRYAMAHWDAQDYQIFYLYEKQPRSDDLLTNQLLQKLAHESQNSKLQTNLRFQSIDVSKAENFELLNSEVQTAWKNKFSGEQSLHVVLTPADQVLSKRRLTVADINELFQSAARNNIAQMLATDHSCVLVLLNGIDSKSNRKAMLLINQAITAAQNAELGNISGKLALTMDEAKSVKVGSYQLNSNNKQEQWFVNSLLQVDNSSRQPDQPIVYAIYGKARAHKPLIGKEITLVNLVQLIDFTNGSCSCVIQEENPGMSLPMSCDWSIAAKQLQAIYGSEDEAPPSDKQPSESAEDLFPDVLVFSSRQKTAETNQISAEASDSLQVEKNNNSAAPSNTEGNSISKNSSISNQMPSKDISDNTVGDSQSMLLTISIGSVAACAIIFLIGHFMMRSKSQ